MKKNIIVILVFAGALLFFSPFFISEKKYQSTTSDIKSDFDGKIIEKIALRKDLLSHIKIKRYKAADTIIFIGENINNVQVGDSILKQKNSPYFYIENKNNITRKYIYVKVLKKDLNDKDFPLLLKNKFENEWKDCVVYR